MKEQILIVDDEPDTAELLRYNLEKASYHTLVVHNGKDAIDAVQRRAPDLVLLDVMMPELNGWEVCRIIRGSAKGTSIPIIMLTALSDDDSRVKGLDLGADDYITKPFSIRELLLKIRNHLGRQQNIKALRTREQEQDTSLRYLVHELRNSLTVIGNYSTIALGKEDTKKYLRTINIAAVHAENLLNDASLLVRLEKEGGSFLLVPVTITVIAEEVVSMFRDVAVQKHVEIGFLNSTASQAMGHRTAVRQVLVNLVSNAIKFSRDNGKVWIQFNETDDWLNISIKDEGCGVPHEELARIFDKFYRAAGSERIKGSGLGLYIVKLLMTTMGGKIMVASDPGQGSTFTVSFPKKNLSSGENNGNDQDPIAKAV